MAKQVWLCDNCQTPFDHADEATQCEDAHKKRMLLAHIKGAKFESLDGSYGIDRSYRQMYPKTIRVKFSDAHGDFATYTLERIGNKAV